jgi:hypothetical protein
MADGHGVMVCAMSGGVSNWTAAALVAGTGAAAVALAHHAFPASTPAASTAPVAGIGGTG